MKQVILVRQDLRLPKGKLAAQVAHAAVLAVEKCSSSDYTAWKDEGSKKVVLKVADETELLEYKKKAGRCKLPVALVTDAGRTVIAPGTKTCIAIGPADDEEIDAITGTLTML
jgi:peptidyl-tRNA hydrolase, PTH2 family